MKQLGIVKSLLLFSGLVCLLLILLLALVAELPFLWLIASLLVLPLLLISGWLIWFVKKRVLQPLRLLEQAVTEIAAGRLDKSFAYPADDEIGRLTAAFERMRQQLWQQQQRQLRFEEERKHFITGISHDLKTPVASISAYTEALQDGMAADPAEEKYYLEVIEKKLAVVTELANQLSLSYLDPENISLALQETDALAWGTAFLAGIDSECRIRGKAVQLTNEVADWAVVRIDPYQLERALQNILSNAYRYAQNFLAVRLYLEAGWLVLEIQNDGVQLRAADPKQLFERFYTEDQGTADGQGHLGLGLYLAKMLIQAMGGTLEAALVGGGKQRIAFKVCLPILRQ